MPFQPGNKLAKNRTKPKEFTDMIRLAVKEAEGDKTKLRVIADKLTSLAIAGDMAAIKEIGDRLEGKAAQTTDLNINPDKTIREMTDAELLSIASGSSTGDAEKEKVAPKPDRLH